MTHNPRPNTNPEFSFDKNLLDVFEKTPSRNPNQANKSKDKKINYSRKSQFSRRRKEYNSQSPHATTKQEYPSAFDMRKKANQKLLDPESIHPYSNQLHGLHTVHSNLMNFLATEKHNLAKKFPFQPQITYKGRLMFEGTGKSVADRSEAWIERKQQHLQKLVNEEQKQQHKLFIILYFSHPL